jgi:hypothetical protein
MAPIKKISLEQTNSSSLESKPVKKSTPTKLPNLRVISLVVAVIAGLTTGFFVARTRLQTPGTSGPIPSALTQNPTDAASVAVGDVFGSADKDSFSDSALGIIQPGGIDGEGSHHLERGIDESQWVYLTSSVIDLDLFLTTEVELWGETFQGKSAGWLMDVGRIKVVGLNAAEVNNIEVSE